MGWQGRTCQERTLFILSILTILFGSFALLFSVMITFLGVAWFNNTNSSSDDYLAIANLTAPGVIASLGMLATGILSTMGSGVCCQLSDGKRRSRLTAALACRFIPVVSSIYLVVYIFNNLNNYSPSPSPPPSPPFAPGGVNPPTSPMPAWPPCSPFPPSWPPTPPYAPFDNGGAGDLFFPNVASLISLAALLIAPIFEIIVLCELRKSGGSTKPQV